MLDFRKILSDTRFPEVMRKAMAVLTEKYHYPVDIEFTANFQPDGSFKFNLLQCRPLQTRGLGKTVELPKVIDRSEGGKIFPSDFPGGAAAICGSSFCCLFFTCVYKRFYICYNKTTGQKPRPLSFRRIMVSCPAKYGKMSGENKWIINIQYFLWTMRKRSSRSL